MQDVVVGHIKQLTEKSFPEKLSATIPFKISVSSQKKENGFPQGLRSVLAKIRHTGCTGKSEWYEVVYYDDDIRQEWCAYAGSNTFKDGEKVVDWKYADECL